MLDSLKRDAVREEDADEVKEVWSSVSKEEIVFEVTTLDASGADTHRLRNILQSITFDVEVLRTKSRSPK